MPYLLKLANNPSKGEANEKERPKKYINKFNKQNNKIATQTSF
jgi:hypothetical protein